MEKIGRSLRMTGKPCPVCKGTTVIPTNRSDFDMCPECNPPMIDKPKKQHSDWCPVNKSRRCYCQFQLANEVIDDYDIYHEAEMNRLLDDLEKQWAFDNGQQHIHTWHTKQDFMERWRIYDSI